MGTQIDVRDPRDADTVALLESDDKTGALVQELTVATGLTLETETADLSIRAMRDPYRAGDPSAARDPCPRDAIAPIRDMDAITRDRDRDQAPKALDHD